MEANHGMTSYANAQTNLQAAPVVVRELSTDVQLRWIERVFARLLAIYGDRFASMWAHTDKDEMKQVWAEALGGFTSEQIADALKICLDEPHAPNLPMFLAYCRRKSVNQMRMIENRNSVSKSAALDRLAEIKRRYDFGKGKSAAANDMEDF